MNSCVMKDYVLFNDVNGNTFLLSDARIDQIEGYRFVLYNVISPENFLCFKHEKEDIQYFIYNATSNSFRPIPDSHGPNWIHHEIMLRANGKSISRLDDQSLGFQWTVDLTPFENRPEPPVRYKALKVKKVLGTFMDDLWVALSTGQILVFDKDTGLLKCEIVDPYFSYSNGKKVFPAAAATCLDIKNGKAIGLFMHSYWEVDCQSFEVSHYDLTNHFDKEAIHSFEDFQFDDQNIYFYDKDNCKVAVFDRNERVIKWQYTIEQVGPLKTFPMKLIKHEDHLYVLDNANSLHVFSETNR